MHKLYSISSVLEKWVFRASTYNNPTLKRPPSASFWFLEILSFHSSMAGKPQAIKSCTTLMTAETMRFEASLWHLNFPLC